MKTGSNVKYVLRLALTLLIITSVVAALLAAVNSVTKPIIDQLNAEKTQKAIEVSCPAAARASTSPMTPAWSAWSTRAKAAMPFRSRLWASTAPSP